MEAGAIQRYANNLKSYGDNVAGLRSALNEGVTLRQNNRLNAIATTQRQKLQNIFLSNIVDDEKLREIHEALGGLAIQAGAAPEALMKLNGAGAFNPIKRGASALANKIRTAGTSARLSGTQMPGDNVGANAYNEEGLSAETGSYVPKDTDAGVQMENFNPMKQAPKPSKLRTTLTKANEPASIEQGSGQPGKFGSNFDLDDDGFHGGSLENFRSGMPGTSSDAITSQIGEASRATQAATTAADTVANTAESAAAGLSSAADTAASAATAAVTTGTDLAGAATGALAGAAEATGLGAALGTAAAIAGPASILAGLGFGIYELVQAFKPRPHPDMKKVKLPSQVKQTMNIAPTHRTLSVAPSANSALLQAGQSSAV